jgi:hypothetical protein
LGEGPGVRASFLSPLLLGEGPGVRAKSAASVDLIVIHHLLV